MLCTLAMAANQPSGHNRFINSLLGWIATHAAMGFSRVFFRYCCGGKVHGEAHIRHALKQGFILAANHGSYLDWMVLGTYFHHVQGVRLIFLAKDRLFRQRRSSSSKSASVSATMASKSWIKETCANLNTSPFFPRELVQETDRSATDIPARSSFP
jgi:hypothetical protein